MIEILPRSTSGCLVVHFSGKVTGQFALVYAGQAARDHDSLVEAVKSGRVQAALGR